MPKLTEAQKLALHGGPPVTEAAEPLKFWKDAEEHAARDAERHLPRGAEEVPEYIFDDAERDIAELRKAFTGAAFWKAVDAFYAALTHEVIAATRGHLKDVDPAIFMRSCDEDIFMALADGWSQRFGKVE
jgi:hypothetical protein